MNLEIDLENIIDDSDQVQNVFYDILDPVYRAGLACPLKNKQSDLRGFSIYCSKEDKTSMISILCLMIR